MHLVSNPIRQIQQSCLLRRSKAVW